MEMIENKKWVKIRKELFEQIRNEVYLRLGSEDSELRAYQKNYEKEFAGKWKPIDNRKMIHLVEKAPVVFYGDFHAHQQSQKTILRILRALPKKSAFAEKILCLECFESKDQLLVDQFMSGQVGESTFLRNIQWEKQWSFPWDYYKGLLAWARRHKFQVVALNKIGRHKNITLRERDQHSAKILAKIRQNYPAAQIHVVFGELHLAQSHLCKEYKKQLKQKKVPVTTPLRIFQNSDEIYFELLQRGMDSKVDAVQLGISEFCILNVPPWVKWHSYLVFLDNSLLDMDLDEDDDGDFDYTDFVSKYVKLISHELKLKISISNLSVYTANDENLWSTMEAEFSSEELKTLEYFIEERISFYLPKLNIAYLARNSINHMASLAMQYVHAQLSSPTKSFIHMPQDFLRLVWMENIAYFGSKLVNPKRKSDTFYDLKVSLLSSKTERRLKEAYKLSIEHKMKEFKAMTMGTGLGSVTSYRDSRVYLKSAFLLGDMLGEKLFHGYREGLISSRTIVSLMKKSISEGNFSEVYLEMVEIVESLPQPFKSKFEKI